MKENLTIKFILILILICNSSYSQDKKSDHNILIDKTIDKYSRHLFLRAFSPYSIVSIRDYETNDYWVVSYFPEKHNKYTPLRDSLNPNKIDLIDNKVRLINNHPVFWTEPNDTSDYDIVVKTMIKYNLIDSFYINSDKNKIYEYDDYPEQAFYMKGGIDEVK